MNCPLIMLTDYHRSHACCSHLVRFCSRATVVFRAASSLPISLCAEDSSSLTDARVSSSDSLFPRRSSHSVETCATKIPNAAYYAVGSDLLEFCCLLAPLFLPELYFSHGHLQVGLELLHDAVLLFQLGPGGFQLVL